MDAFSRDELEDAFRSYWRTGAVEERWSAWADLFTDEVEYIEHQLGNKRGRDAVREWIVPLMERYPEIYTAYEWHVIDPSRGRVVFAMQNRRDHPNGVDRIDFSGLSIIDYAGDGKWRRQEDYWAVEAGKQAFVRYAEAVKALDPDHPKLATRRDWGSGPEWCQGPATNVRLRRI